VTEQVRYQFVAAARELRRSTNPNDPACEAVVADGIVNITLAYLNANGNPIANPGATPADIRTVVVAMSVTSNNGGTEQTVVMRDQVRIRNR
jgi:hypothetical protein